MAKESAEHLRKRTLEIIRRLRKKYPHARTALEFSKPLELLVATILSAQCTDKRVNMITPALFAKYRGAADFAKADSAKLQQEIRSTGFYRNKTKSIIGACRKIIEEFDGAVPDTMEDLLKLPGVARKTANVVLGGAFGKNEGIAVDTHVTRLAGRLGLTTFDKPEKIEQDLMALVPRKGWSEFSHLLIYLGREICAARKPLHDICPLKDICPSANI